MSRLGLSSLVILSFLTFVAPPSALAQEAGTVEAEEAGTSRGGYAWGAAPTEEGGATAAYHQYGGPFASVGAGGTVRIVAHADVCNPDTPGLEGCRFSPPYLQLRGGWFFEGDGDIQHGVGLGIATNLAPDGRAAEGIDAGGQWTLTPTYLLRIWLSDWFQVVGQLGVPLAISNVTGFDTTGASFAQTAFNWGLELQLNLVFKFLTGLGVYVGANVAAYFAGTDSVWPTVSFEGGLVFDYEVLP